MNTKTTRPYEPQFMKHIWLYFLISAVLIVASISSLVMWQFTPSIDFTGGAILELKSESLSTLPSDQLNENIGSKVEKIEGLNLNSVQKTGDKNIYIKTNSISENQKLQLVASLLAEDELAEEVSFETVGPALGAELIRKTIYAVLIAGGFIMLYVAYRFKDKKFGICAILAMFHDTLILLGVFSLLGHFYEIEIDTLFVTAVLTILSFSVHDTVVVYDRIRESMRQFPSTDFTRLVNKAVAETLSRSVTNSLTIIFMLTALFLLGGETIRWFVFALLIGTVVGTYSSTFTAAPLLVLWNKIEAGKKKSN